MFGHKINVLWFAVFLAAARPAAAQESAAFLKIGMGARAVALGGAYTALADDADSVYWNPAGLAGLSRPEMSMTHAQMFLGDSYDSLAVSMPLGSGVGIRAEDLTSWKGHRTATAYYREAVPRGVLGFGFSRLGQANQQGRGADRRPTGSFGASDMSLAVAYARPVWVKGFQAGVSVKRIESRIADAKASVTAFDLGAVYHIGAGSGAVPGGRRWRLGVSVRNLGQGLGFERESSPLPLTLGFGAAAQTPVGLLVSMEVQHRPNANKTNFSIGTEYPVLAAMTLRAGYLQNHSAAGGAGPSPIGSLGGGIGLKWGKFFIDYSITPFGELGSVQRVSVRASW